MLLTFKHRLKLANIDCFQYFLSKCSFWVFVIVCQIELWSRFTNKWSPTLEVFESEQCFFYRTCKLRFLQYKIICMYRNLNQENIVFCCHVSAINLSNYDISSSCLRYGQHQSFINKNRFVKLNLSVEFKLLVSSDHEFFSQEMKEDFISSLEILHIQ